MITVNNDHAVIAATVAVFARFVTGPLFVVSNSLIVTSPPEDTLNKASQLV